MSRVIRPAIASISEATRSGAAYCTMWPTPGNTMSFACGAVAASNREWMPVVTVLSTSPETIDSGALISA